MKGENAAVKDGSVTVAAGTMKRTLVVFVLLATATAVAQDNKNPVHVGG
jgi:hypothetical protein